MEIETTTGGNLMVLPQNVEKIKLEKKCNAKGETRYEWEIQIVGLDVERLAKINGEMVAKYGS